MTNEELVQYHRIVAWLDKRLQNIPDEFDRADVGSELIALGLVTMFGYDRGQAITDLIECLSHLRNISVQKIGALVSDSRGIH